MAVPLRDDEFPTPGAGAEGPPNGLEPGAFDRVMDGWQETWTVRPPAAATIDPQAFPPRPVGLVGIFLNIRGREEHGIVAKGQEAEELKAEIAALEKEVETGRPIRTPRG